MIFVIKVAEYAISLPVLAVIVAVLAFLWWRRLRRAGSVNSLFGRGPVVTGVVTMVSRARLRGKAGTRTRLQDGRSSSSSGSTSLMGQNGLICDRYQLATRCAATPSACQRTI